MAVTATHAAPDRLGIARRLSLYEAGRFLLDQSLPCEVAGLNSRRRDSVRAIVFEAETFLLAQVYQHGAITFAGRVIDRDEDGRLTMTPLSHQEIAS